MRLERAKPRQAPALVGIVETGLPASSPVERDFAVLYGKAHDVAINQAFLALNDLDEARDAVQEAALELFEHWAELLPEDKTVSTFLVRVRYRVLDHMRHRVRTIAIPDEGSEDEVIHDMLVTPSVAIAHEGLEATKLLDDAVRQLPPRARKVWHLVRELRMTHEEAAEALGMAKGSVAKHMQLTRRALLVILDKAGYRLTDSTIRRLGSPATTEERDA